MNVIVSNKQKEIIDNANIDAIKDLNGLFNVNDLINKFKNYFFSKMILDATSIVDFASNDVLKKLADEIGADRLIVLLPSTPEPPDEFKKLLIDLKIYNFSNNIEDVVKFIDNPNTYENAMSTLSSSYENTDGFYVDNSIKDSDNDNLNDNHNLQNSNDNQVVDNSFNQMNNISNTGNMTDNDSQVRSSHVSLGDIMNNINISGSSDNFHNYDSVKEINSNAQSNSVVQEVDNQKNSNLDLNAQALSNYNLNDYGKVLENSAEEDSNEKVNTNNENRTYSFLNMDGFDNVSNSAPSQKKVIGFKNVTLHAGSTTLIYMLHMALQKKGKDVLSVEVNRDDFKLFRNSKMVSMSENDIINRLSNAREELVLVDLNDCHDDSFCDDVIYLVEPSIIKLNRLMVLDKTIFNTLKNKKVVLNQSMLSSSDIPILEQEAGLKFFDCLGSLNDRIDNSQVNGLLDKLVS